MVVQSYLFDFQRTPLFFDKLNIDYSVLEMQSSNNLFEIVFSDYASDNINECLNGSVLNTDNVHIAQSGNAKVDCSLKWENDTIRIRNDVEWTIGDNNIFLKAMFLRHKATGSVLGYCIHMNSFDVTNKVKFDADTILWSIVDG